MTQPSTDSIDVLNVVHAYFNAADARDWDRYRALHSDRIDASFDGVNDDSDGDVSADEMVESAKSLLGPVHLTQHMISNEVVDLDGDHATVAFYEQALHHHPALGDDPNVNTWVLYGRVVHRLERGRTGWRLVGAQLTTVHQTGNADLLTQVAALSA